MLNWQRIGLYTLGILAVLALTFYGGASWGRNHSVAKAVAAQAQSNQHEGAAKASEAQAETADRASAAQKATVDRAEAQVASTKRRLSELPSIPSLPAQDQLPAALATISQQAEVIKAQDQEIAALKLQDSLDRASADQWHKAYDESQRALEAQKTVSAAYQSAMRQQGWKSGFKGALAGVAVGYLASKAHH